MSDLHGDDPADERTVESSELPPLPPLPDEELPEGQQLRLVLNADDTVRLDSNLSSSETLDALVAIAWAYANEHGIDLDAE